MMPLSALVTAIALLLFGTTPAQKPSRPDVHKIIAAPEDEDVVLVAHASGSQIYVCQAGTDRKLSWTLKGPEAGLSDDSGKNIGRHFAGTSDLEARRRQRSDRQKRHQRGRARRRRYSVVAIESHGTCRQRRFRQSDDQSKRG